MLSGRIKESVIITRTFVAKIYRVPGTILNSSLILIPITRVLLLFTFTGEETESQWGLLSLQGLPASKCWCWDLNLSSLTLKPPILTLEMPSGSKLVAMREGREHGSYILMENNQKWDICINIKVIYLKTGNHSLVGFLCLRFKYQDYTAT